MGTQHHLNSRGLGNNSSESTSFLVSLRKKGSHHFAPCLLIMLLTQEMKESCCQTPAARLYLKQTQGSPVSMQLLRNCLKDKGDAPSDQRMEHLSGGSSGSGEQTHQRRSSYVGRCPTKQAHPALLIVLSIPPSGSSISNWFRLHSKQSPPVDF